MSAKNSTPQADRLASSALCSSILSIREAGLPAAEPAALMTVPEFCTWAKIGRTLVYRLISQRRIQAVKIGKATRITRVSAEAFIASLPTVAWTSPE